MNNYKAILIGNGTMGKRHRARFESCGVSFLQVVDFGDVVDCSLSPDFVVVASPAKTHFDYVRYFLERKIPVFVEKPLATSGAQVQELVDLSLQNNTLLFVGQSECFNPIFLNFRKHFLAELKNLTAVNCSGVSMTFRREHRYTERCRDVDVSLDLLVHDLSLFFTLFNFEDVEKVSYELDKCGDAANMLLRVNRGPYAGLQAQFIVNRASDVDVRNVAVKFEAKGKNLGSEYSVSLVHYEKDGGVAHIPDSMDNEHRFFMKLLKGACGNWAVRAMVNAANVVKIVEHC